MQKPNSLFTVTSVISFVLASCFLLCSVVLVASPMQAQERQAGFWVAAGAGGSWNTLPGLDAGSTPNFGGYIRVGGTPTDRWLVGFEVLGWMRPVSIPTELGNYVFSAVNFSAIGILYPVRRWPVYLKAGLGASTVDISVDPQVGFQLRTRHNGIGATAGVGAELLAVGPLFMGLNLDWAGQLFGRQRTLDRIDQNGFVVMAAGIRWR